MRSIRAYTLTPLGDPEPALTLGVRYNRTMTERRLNLQDAAGELGITPDALRQRIRRGQYRSEKSEGRVYIYLPADRTTTEPGVHLESDALISELRAHVEDLRAQLDQAHERDRENRRIIVALTSRIPELEAPTEPPDASVGATEQPGRVEPQAPIEGAQEPLNRRYRWWQFWR